MNSEKLSQKKYTKKIYHILVIVDSSYLHTHSLFHILESLVKNIFLWSSVPILLQRALGQRVYCNPSRGGRKAAVKKMDH